MKTIEERAKEYLSYERDFLGRNPSDNMVCRAYVKGATEQKAIDIEKAHEAFVELLAVQYGEDCDESMHQYIDDALNKALEE